MKDIFFFDSNCQIGPTVFAAAPGASELLAEMDHFGIEKALVMHNNFARCGSMTNDALAAMLAADDPEKRLTGVWGILPVQCDEMPAPDEFFCRMRDNRIGAITFSLNQAFIPCRLTLGKIIDEAQKRRIPVLLTTFDTKWQQLYDFLKEFPDICGIISAGKKWGADRYFRPLMASYPNLRLSLANYWVTEGIADLAEIYGAERLLFGSGFPTLDLGNQMLQLKHSGLDEKSIALVAGKNMQNLVEAIQW